MSEYLVPLLIISFLILLEGVRGRDKEIDGNDRRARNPAGGAHHGARPD